MSKAEVKTICIAGASGLAGAYMVKEALARGYRVNGTLRDISQLDKVSGLMRLPGAAERLHLFSADNSVSESFDAPLTQLTPCSSPAFQRSNMEPMEHLLPSWIAIAA